MSDDAPAEKKPAAFVCLPPDPNPHPPAFEVPGNACDAHVHIFGHVEQFPQTNTELFVPPLATFEMYSAIQARLGLTRAVIVHPAAYGTELACTIDALRRAEGRWRAVALADSSIAEEEIHRLDGLGFRGVRFNFPDGGSSIAELRRLAAKVGSFGWHAQLLITLDTLADCESELSAIGIPLVIDHMGYSKAEAAAGHPGFQALLRLVSNGEVWVKISGVDRIGNRSLRYEDARRLADHLIEASEDRIVWGTDWPHVRRRTVPNDGMLLNLLGEWVSDTTLRRKILVDNPQRLYRF
jgi:predicted TIM-barrel fold metal-dependent hydrolase